ncbi:MAG: ferredoxin reductase family protein [Candidatus Saccharibacteria bacterium]
MIKTQLLTGNPTTRQVLVIGAWYGALLLSVIMWATTSAELLTNGSLGGTLLAMGRLFGILATVFALTQFLLMGRILWIERPFGLDHLASYHRFNGYATMTLILLHPLFVVAGYTVAGQTNFSTTYLEVIQRYSYVWWALIAELLFGLVVVTSIFIVRHRLKFESWYGVHILVYAAIVLVFFHQFAVGGSFIGHPLARAYWYGVYVFVGLNVLFFRFTLPTLNLVRFGFRVNRVVTETPTTTSVYISGRNLSAWRARPGQFVLVRFLNRQYGLQEHPFSLSAIPSNNEFRLTIRHAGDFTNTIGGLTPGTAVLVSGPFGRFTSELAVTDKLLFIAGGVGITPLRPLIKEAMAQHKDGVLVYGNRTPSDVVFVAELRTFGAAALPVTEVYSDPPPTYRGPKGYVTAELVQQLVPDLQARDIYLCGPPAMMDGIIDGLLTSGFPRRQLHYERFSLHR